MIPIFILIGTTSKILNLKLRKRKEELRKQQDMMGKNAKRSAAPEKIDVV